VWRRQQYSERRAIVADPSVVILRGRGLGGGIAEGEALVTKEFFGFTHGVIPATGEISDERHEWRGLNLKGRVIVFPKGKSSSSGGVWIIETARCGNLPAAIVNIEAEPITGAGCILAKVMYGKAIPLVDRLDNDPCDTIKTGDLVRVNGETGVVEVLKRDEDTPAI
jgi:predicted aconitase with swiveling domain